MKNKFYTQGTIDVLLNLDINNNNIHIFSKKVGLSWVSCRKILDKLSHHDLVKLTKVKCGVIISLTDEGIFVRNSLLSINQIILKNKDKYKKQVLEMVLEESNEIH